jgi:hypothetical protein
MSEMGMQGRGGRWMVLGLLVGLGMMVWVWRGVGRKTGMEERTEGRILANVPTGGRAEVRPGDAILKGYGKAEGTVQGDLTAMAEVLGNFALLVKGSDPLPLGANEELVAALRGKNAVGLEFVSGESAALNEKGQLVDRWGTPLFFHARARDEVDIRSAGPDREMWTGDDVHRLHDGRYLRGEALEAPSLLEAGMQRRAGSGGAERRE